jgi:hypothetical protein
LEGWWGWTKWALYYLVTIVLLLAIYSQVIQTRFECVVFSVLALIYVELIAQYSAWGVGLLGERDHRNEIHRMLSERLGAPIEPEMNEAIEELSKQTAKAGIRHRTNRTARGLLCLLILWNLFKAAFFGWGVSV